MTFVTELGMEVLAGESARQIFRGAHKLKQFSIALKGRFQSGSLGIFIFGPQGTGKTTLLRVIAGRAEINDVPTQYISSPANEYRSTKENFFYKVLAGPGQESLQSIHWPKMYAEMNKYDRVICIFCASYGCHAIFEESFSSLKAGTINQNDDLAINEYLNLKRQEEAKVFKSFCAKLEAVQGEVGLMILVTKQDLWWDERGAVEKHYGRGAFATCLKRLAEAKKAVGFVHATKSASLSIQNLLTSDNRLIRPTVSGYDQLHQRANFEAFQSKLIEMAESLTGKRK